MVDPLGFARAFRARVSGSSPGESVCDMFHGLRTVNVVGFGLWTPTLPGRQTDATPGDSHPDGAWPT